MMKFIKDGSVELNTITVKSRIHLRESLSEMVKFRIKHYSPSIIEGGRRVGNI